MKLIIDNCSFLNNYRFVNNNNFAEIVINPGDKVAEIIQQPIQEKIQEIFIHVNLRTGGQSRQHNCGVVLYRELLRCKKINPDIQKVCFYSFLSNEECVRISKGRDVMLLFEQFVSFSRIPELAQSLIENTPLFEECTEKLYYGPELLLAGWGMNAFAKNNKTYTKEDYLSNKACGENNFLLIDDKAKHWKPVLNIVLSNSIKEIDASRERIKPIVLKLKKETNIDSNNLNSLLGIEKETSPFDFIHRHDAILLDLFLNPDGAEIHDSQKRLTEEKTKSISGSKMLKLLQNVHPGIPIVMFTKSSRVWNYKTLSNIGADEWWAKPGTNTVINNDTICDYYLDFRDTITKINNTPFPEIKKLTKDIKAFLTDFENADFDKEEYLKSLKPKKSEIIKLFKQSLFTLRFSYKFDKDHDYYLYSSIVEQIVNIVELVEDSFTNKHFNKYFVYSRFVRNFASHADEYQNIDIIDVLLIFQQLIMGIRFHIEKGKVNHFVNLPTAYDMKKLKYVFLPKAIYLFTYVLGLETFTDNENLLKLYSQKLNTKKMQQLIYMLNTISIKKEINHFLNYNVSETSKNIYIENIQQKKETLNKVLEIISTKYHVK